MRDDFCCRAKKVVANDMQSATTWWRWGESKPPCGVARVAALTCPRHVIHYRSRVRFSQSFMTNKNATLAGDVSVCGGDGENRTPVRKRFLRNFSGRRRLFAFPHPRASRHARGLSSFMMHGTLKALRTHGPHSSTPRPGPWDSRERRSRDYAARRTVLSLFFNL